MTRRDRSYEHGYPQQQDPTWVPVAALAFILLVIFALVLLAGRVA